MPTHCSGRLANLFLRNNHTIDLCQKLLTIYVFHAIGSFQLFIVYIYGRLLTNQNPEWLYNVAVLPSAHHLGIITDDVDQAHKEKMIPPCNATIKHLSVSLIYLLLFFLSKDEWIKIWNWDILSPGSQKRGLFCTLRRKPWQAHCLAKQENSATKAIMPGHLVDIIIKTEISSSDRWWQSRCFQAPCQAQLSGTCVTNSGRLQKWMS